MKPREMSVISTAVNKLYVLEKVARRDLLENARAGDVGALCILRERSGVRLPLVEDWMGLCLPWKRSDATISQSTHVTAGPTACRAA